MIDEDLAGYLVASAAIQGFVQNDDDEETCRIDPNRLKAAVYPAITYQRISYQQVRNMHGSSGLERCRFQINSWAKLYSEAKGLAHEVKLRLNNFSGVMGASTVDAIFMVGESDVPDPKLNDGDEPIFGVRQDFEIRFQTSE